MRGNRAAHIAAAEHEVENAGGNARFLDNLRQRRGHGRSDVGGLQHHRIAESQRRGGFPCRNGDREVPRRDQPDHAQRLAIGRDIEPRPGGFERLAVAAQRLAAEIAEDARGAQHFALPLGPGLALLAREKLAQFRRAGEDQRRDLVEQVGTHFGRSRGPGRERLAGRGDGLIDFGGAAIGEAGDDIAGIGRVDAFQRVVCAGPFAADEVTEFLHIHW